VTFLGNVGIAMAPSEKLDVNGGIRATGSTTASSGAGVELDFGTFANTGRIFAYDRSGSVFKDFGIGDFNDGRGILVQASGNVGIGKSNPSATLDVFGDARFYAGNDSAGNTVMAVTSVNGTAFSCNSYGLPFHAHNDSTGTDVTLAGGVAGNFSGGVSV